MGKASTKLALFLAAQGAQPALACAVCFSGRDESRVAYLLTTIFMTSLPILALGALVWWVVRKAQQVDSKPR
jgi:hypothetical protein